MNTSSGITAYESDSYSHRLVVETSLIYACNTIKGNKSTSSTRDIDLFAPKILQGAPLNWKDLARVQSSTFKADVIPRKHLKLFRSSHNNHTSPSTNFSDSGPFPISIPHSSDDLHVPRHSYNLRSHRQLASQRLRNQEYIRFPLNILILTLFPLSNVVFLFILSAALMIGQSMKPR